MGEIDLDPASDDVGQQWIQATNYYTLHRMDWIIPWFGRVWLHPAHGKTTKWINKLLAEYEFRRVCEAVLLVTPSGSKWFQKLTRLFPVCFPDEQLRFSMTKVDLCHDPSMAMPSSILVRTSSGLTGFGAIGSVSSPV